LSEAAGIAKHAELVGKIYLDTDTLFLSEDLDSTDGLYSKSGQVEWRPFQVEHPAVRSGKKREIIDQMREVIALHERLFRALLFIFGPVCQAHFGCGPHDSQRRSQLVRGVGHEVSLTPQGLADGEERSAHHQPRNPTGRHKANATDNQEYLQEGLQTLAVLLLGHARLHGTDRPAIVQDWFTVEHVLLTRVDACREDGDSCVLRCLGCPAIGSGIAKRARTATKNHHPAIDEGDEDAGRLLFGEWLVASFLGEVKDVTELPVSTNLDCLPDRLQEGILGPHVRDGTEDKQEYGE